MNSSRRTGVRVWASWTPRQGSRRWGAPHAGTHPQDPRGPESCTRGRQGGAFRKQRVQGWTSNCKEEDVTKKMMSFAAASTV